MAALVLVTLSLFSAAAQDAPDAKSVKDASPQTFSTADAQRVLQGPCRVLTSTSLLPANLKQAFAKLTKDKAFRLANPQEKYQATDILMNPKLPVRRLVIAGKCGEFWFVHYERGGRGQYYALVIFREQANGIFAFVWGGHGFGKATTYGALSHAIATDQITAAAPDSSY